MSEAPIIAYLEHSSAMSKSKRRSKKILDFGCGRGLLVAQLKDAGWDAYGVDIEPLWEQGSDFCSVIEEPYRFPFEGNFFDFVLSTSVLEHVQCKLKAFLEIHRVMKSGGLAIHQFPSKFYVPAEPHIKVPFVNCLYPHVPDLYLLFIAMLGIRNEHQNDMHWKAIAKENKAYINQGLSYWSEKQYIDVLKNIYHDAYFDYSYVAFGNGGTTLIDARLPSFLRTYYRKAASCFKNTLLVCQK